MKRVEYDSLGPVEVEAEALWGPQTQRSLENFPIGEEKMPPEEYRKALSFCGSHSGRDCDKAKETGLTPAEIDGCVTFAESELVLVCRKLYSYDLQESGFITDDGIPEKFFNGDAYHRAYISEIVGVYVKE